MARATYLYAPTPATDDVAGMTTSPRALSACTNRIRSANDRFSKSFHDWITTVGGELRKAQELLSKDGSHDSQFGKWCTDEFGWTRQHAYHLLDADETMRLMSTIVDVKSLPSNEGQCRELVCVPDDDLPKVWKKVVKDATKEKKPITAKLIRQYTEPYRVESNGRSGPSVQAFDEDKAGDRLRDWIRAELDKWPEKDRPIAAYYIRAVLEQEYRL